MINIFSTYIHDKISFFDVLFDVILSDLVILVPTFLLVNNFFKSKNTIPDRDPDILFLTLKTIVLDLSHTRNYLYIYIIYIYHSDIYYIPLSYYISVCVLTMILHYVIHTYFFKSYPQENHVCFSYCTH